MLRFHDLTAFRNAFDEGLTLDQARERAGYGACSITIAILLDRYWALMELEKIFSCDRTSDAMLEN